LFYLPSVQGQPTTTPIPRPGSVPLVFDELGQKIWAFVGGRWIDASQAAATTAQLTAIAQAQSLASAAQTSAVNQAQALSMNAAQAVSSNIQSGAVSKTGDTMSGQLGVPSIKLGMRTYATETSQNLWLTSNAYWDGTNWQRVDVTMTAFALNMQSHDPLPNSTAKGIVIWKASAGANPIGTAINIAGGWEQIYTWTEQKAALVAGYGVEIDSLGNTPYGRILNYNTGNAATARTGIASNFGFDLSTVDNNTSPGWYFGKLADSFVVQRAPAGSGAASLVSLISIDNAGNVTLASGSITTTFRMPSYTVANLPQVMAVDQGKMAYATNGRNGGEVAGAGTGCVVTVNSNGIWSAIWSGLTVTA